MNKKFYEANMAVLKVRAPVLVNMIKSKYPVKYSYRVEKAKSGEPTLIAEKDGVKVTIHSRYNPIEEALQQVKTHGLKPAKILIIHGFGLAYHIRAALHHLFESCILCIIVESDPNAFRIAVENVDLADIFQADGFRYMIGVPIEEVFVTFRKLLQGVSPNAFLSFKSVDVFELPPFRKIAGPYLDQFLKEIRVAIENMMVAVGNSSYDSLIGIRNLLMNLETVMRNPGAIALKGAFKGLPGIVISTGPTLNKNIEDLRPAIGKSVMISADSALRILLGKNIKPQMFASLERVPALAGVLEGLTVEQMQDVWMAGIPVLDKKMYDTWKGPTVISYRNISFFEWLKIDKGIVPAGISCSNLAFGLLSYMGCDPIILVGQDCSFISAQITHADGAHEATNLSLKETSLFPIKGNYEETVKTNWVFNAIRKEFLLQVANFKGTCINSTAGGAFIEGTTLMPLRDAVEKYCVKDFDPNGAIRKILVSPTDAEIGKTWTGFHQVAVSTECEIEALLKLIAEGEKIIFEFEDEARKRNINSIEDFMEHFPDELLLDFRKQILKVRVNIYSFHGKHLRTYITHIIQMVVAQTELDLSELDILCDERKRCHLQELRIMKKFFPAVRVPVFESLEILKQCRKQNEGIFGIPTTTQYPKPPNDQP